MLLIAWTVFGSMAVLFVSALQQRRAALQTTADEAVLLSHLAASQQERIIAVAREMLDDLAQREARAVAHALPTGAGGVVRDVASVAPSGKVISSTDPAEVGADVSKTDWFQRAASRRRFVVGRHDEPAGDSAATLRAAEPVLGDGGRLDAVVVATLDLSRLTGTMAPASLDSVTSYMLVDRHGIVIVPGRTPAMPADSVIAMRQALAAGAWQQEVRGSDGRWRIVAFTPLQAPGTRGLYVGVGIDRDALVRHADRELQIGIVLMALFGITVGLLAWRGMHAIVLRRVEAMLEMTRRLRQGDLHARTGLAYGSGELSDLCRALDSMAASLATDHAARARAELRARLSEARTRAVLEASIDGIFVVNREGRLVECNEAGQRMLALRRGGEVTGRNVSGQSIEQALGISIPVMDAPKVLESALPRPGDEDLPVEIVLSPVRHFAAEGYVVATVRDISERRRWERTLEAQSLTDELTGLHNRRGFLTLANQRMQLLSRTGETAVLVSLDLDGLKAINDTYGHGEGDRALRALADVLRRSFRETDVIGRIGGDEFVVLATVSGPGGLGRALGRLANAIVERNSAGDLPWLLRASVGWSRSPASANEPLSALLARADRNMYRRKKARSAGRPTLTEAPRIPRTAGAA
jgi:diguanylate cyclase (GGDEF)-like protein/PAS domain S-box-containing protein